MKTQEGFAHKTISHACNIPENPVQSIIWKWLNFKPIRSCSSIGFYKTGPYGRVAYGISYLKEKNKSCLKFSSSCVGEYLFFSFHPKYNVCRGRSTLSITLNILTTRVKNGGGPGNAFLS